MVASRPTHFDMGHEALLSGLPPMQVETRQPQLAAGMLHTQ